MNRSDFYDELAHEVGISKAKSRKYCDALFDIMAAKIAEEERVYIFGLGTFTKKRCSSKRIGDIVNGGSIEIPPYTKIDFKPADSLIEVIKEIEED